MRGGNNNTKVVVFTGGGGDVSAKYLKAGACDCLFAPLCKELLETRINSALQVLFLKVVPLLHVYSH